MMGDMSVDCDCCGFGCTIAADDFEREEVGEDWDQIDGTWEIESGHLRSADPDALILYSIPHPQGITAHIITVRMRDEEGKAKTLWMQNEDGSEWLSLTVIFGPSSGNQCGTVKLNDHTSELKSRPMNGLPENTWVVATLCFLTSDEIGGGIAWGYVSGNGTCNRSMAAFSSFEGLRVGLKNGSTSTAGDFDDFGWFVHEIDGNDEYSEFQHCSECSSCPIWTWYGQEDDCEFNITGDPRDPLGGAWEIDGLISASDADAAGGMGIIAEVPGSWTGEITLTLGGYEAHFYVPEGETFIRCDLTGPGVSESEDFDNGIYSALSYIDGVLCATTGWTASEGNKSLIATPATPLTGASASASGPDGRTNLVVKLSRCPQCPSDNVCDSCEDDTTTPLFMKVTLGGFGPSDPATMCDSFTCDYINGTFICEQVFGFPCRWRFLHSNIEDGCQLEILVEIGGGGIAVTATIDWMSPTLGFPQCTQVYTFIKDFSPDPVPCDAIGHNIPYDSFEDTGHVCFDIQGIQACKPTSTPTCHVQGF